MRRGSYNRKPKPVLREPTHMWRRREIESERGDLVWSGNKGVLAVSYVAWQFLMFSLKDQSLTEEWRQQFGNCGNSLSLSYKRRAPTARILLNPNYPKRQK